MGLARLIKRKYSRHTRGLIEALRAMADSHSSLAEAAALGAFILAGAASCLKLGIVLDARSYSLHNGAVRILTALGEFLAAHHNALLMAEYRLALVGMYMLAEYSLSRKAGIAESRADYRCVAIGIIALEVLDVYLLHLRAIRLIPVVSADLAAVRTV